jgi:hypothetical protein
MSKQNQNIILSHVIICDDIRKEINNKLILIGVYPEDIILYKIPAEFRISLWFQFKISAPTKFGIEININGNALKKKPDIINFQIDETKDNLAVSESEKDLSLVIAGIPLSIQDTGNITIEYRKSGDKPWISAKTNKILLNKPPK